MPFDGTQIDEVTRVLLSARDRLANGWCTRARHRGDAFCALGALAFEADGYANGGLSNTYRAAYERLFNALTDEQRAEAISEYHQHWLTLPSGGLSAESYVAQYNNSQTSVEPVLEWFDKAAQQGFRDAN